MLGEQGFEVSQKLVGVLLRDLDYSLQANRKTTEGNQHPDRNAQFEHINAQAEAARGQPVISVDTKKKELVGDFKNGGREWQPKGKPVPVRVHDFVDKVLGKAIPYGIYDIGRNDAWVNVGVDRRHGRVRRRLHRALVDDDGQQGLRKRERVADHR